MITDFCEHFNLSEDPFMRETFYPAATHMNLLNELRHLLQFGESALVLTGRTGVGKSTLLRQLSTQLDSEVLIITAQDFASLDLLLLTLCEELLLPVNDGMSVREMESLIASLAREQDPSAAPVIIVDCADALPQGAMLSLLRLAAPDNSRVAIRLLLVCPEGFASDLPAKVCPVIPLSLAESVGLLNACMYEVGYQGPDVFTSKHVEPWWHEAEGNLNVLQDRARQWLIALASKPEEPSRVSKALSATKLTPIPLAHMVTVAALVGVLGTVYLYRSDSDAQTATTVVSIPERPVSPVIIEPAPVPLPPSEPRVEPQVEAPDPSPVAEEPPVEPASLSPTLAADSPPGVGEPEVSAPVSTVAESAQPLRPAASQLGQDEQLLLSWPESAYTIQVLAVAARDSAESFVARHSETPLLVLKTERGGRPWFVVVTGRFSSLAEARQAQQRLPAALREAGPWPRRVGELQEQLQ